MKKARVALVKKESRRQNLLSVLDLLKEDIEKEIRGKERVVIKVMVE